MYEVKAIIREALFEDVMHALHSVAGMPGVTVSIVRGYGTQRTAEGGHPAEFGDAEFAKLETVVPEPLLEPVLKAIEDFARTGRRGDGKIFVMPVQQAIRVRTGERGENSL
jgi:nitrogen regulatory protein P-II 1